MRIEMRPLALAAQAERPREIDHARAPARERRPDLRRERVGDRQEHRVGFLGQPVGIEALDRAVPNPLQRRDPSCASDVLEPIARRTSAWGC